MPRPLDLGRAVLFAGSALLLISLFTEWYDVGLTGWQVFETLDLVLAALAVGGMVASLRPDLLPPWAGGALPAAALLIVVVQLIDGPPAAGDADPSGGAWVALAGSFLMAAGAALSLADISVTVSVQERELRRRVPAVDRRNEDAEAEAAEDLDADAPSGSLFATGLGVAPDAAEADADAAPPRRTGRFSPREPSGAPTPTATGGRGDAAAAPAGRPEPADLERTQPLTSLPDDPDAPERP